MSGAPTRGPVVPTPPSRLPGVPVVTTLQAGRRLRRVHRVHPADVFNPTPSPNILAGGRFDSLDGAFAYIYLGDSDEAAIAETLCRDLPLDGSPRVVPRVRVSGRRMTSVEVTRDLRILVLHGAALSQVGAGLWLTKSDADQYVATRHWASWLHGQLPDIDGFEYRCRHDEDELAWVLFDGLQSGRSRAAASLQALQDTMDLDIGLGLLTVKRVLATHNADIEPG